MKNSTFLNVLGAMFFALIGALVCLGATMYVRIHSPEADIFRAGGAPSMPEVRETVLSRGKKLKDADWHCYAGGGCELWLLTRTRAPEDKPETYYYQNADGSRIYVIKEQ